MKLYLASATVVAVTNLMLKHGSGEDATLVPAKAMTFRAEVDPKQLDELRDGLADTFFEEANGKSPRVPAIPELAGAIGWGTEYQGGTLELTLEHLSDLDFSDKDLVLGGVDAKDITFQPLTTGRVDFKVNAIIVSDDAKTRGKLDALLRHELPVKFTKLTQKPLAAPPKPKDDAAGAQGELGVTQH